MRKAMAIFWEKLQSINFIKRILIILLVSVLVGISAEGITGLLRYEKAGGMKGITDIEELDLELESLDKSNGEWKASPDGATITISFDHTYINKFVYDYQSNIQLDNKITITYENTLGEESDLEIIDNIRNQLYRSVVNINETVKKISIQTSANSELDLKFSGFEVDNSFKFNWIRAAFGIAVCFICLFLFVCSRDYRNKVELAFLMLAFPIGLMFLIAQPPHMNGWDEHIHITRCYNEAMGINGQSGAVKFLYENQENYSLPIQSIEERRDEIQFLNELDKVPAEEPIQSANLGLQKVGYIFQIGVFKLGYTVGLPFSIILLLARFTNLILYCTLIYFAIKKLPVGKHLMMAVALIPTTLFITSTLSYDTVVNAFLMLASAVLISAFCKANEKMSISDQIVFIVCMVIASCPKAVYIPLLLIGLFLPAKKFNTARQMYVFKAVIIIGFIGMMSTFVLPMLFSSEYISDASDARGGDLVNTGMQFRLILTHPLAYTKVLISNILDSMMDSTFIAKTLSHFSHSNIIRYPFTELVLLTVVTISDNYIFKDNGKKVHHLPAKLKGIILFAILGTTCIIWTALYLSFTPVGSLVIAGVQGRYYLPFFFLLLFLLRPKNIKVRIAKKWYQLIIFGSASLILLYSIYNSMLMVTAL